MIRGKDRILIVFAAARPEPHLRMLDRFLVLCESSALEPVVIVNKVDLVDDSELLVSEVYDEGVVSEVIRPAAVVPEVSSDSTLSASSLSSSDPQPLASNKPAPRARARARDLCDTLRSPPSTTRTQCPTRRPAASPGRTRTRLQSSWSASRRRVTVRETLLAMPVGRPFFGPPCQNK